MGQFDEQIKQAMAAYKAGRKQEARDTLMAVVDQDERHEQAWLLLSGIVETLDEQQICLENVLAINPSSDKALKGLEILKQKRAGQPPAASAFSSPFSGFEPPAAPQPPQPAPKRGSSAPIGAEDIGPGSDIFGSKPAASAADGSTFDFPSQFSVPADDAMDWLTGGSAAPATPAQTPDSFGIPTSVDWGRTDKPAAYGSGRQVELPSAQEYDEWVQNLNLGGAPNTGPAPANNAPPSAASNDPFDGAAVFGDTSFMVDSGPFTSDDSTSDNSNIFEASWGNKPAPSDSARASSSFSQGPFSSYEDEDTGPMSPFSMAAEPAPAAYETPEPEERLSFSFDEDDDDQESASTVGFDNIWHNDFEAAPAAVPAQLKPRPSMASASQSDYYRYIPDEIQAKSGGYNLRSLLLLVGVIVMLVLNAASFALLLAG